MKKRKMKKKKTKKKKTEENIEIKKEEKEESGMNAFDPFIITHCRTIPVENPTIFPIPNGGTGAIHNPSVFYITNGGTGTI